MRRAEYSASGKKSCERWIAAGKDEKGGKRVNYEIHEKHSAASRNRMNQNS